MDCFVVKPSRKRCILFSPLWPSYSSSGVSHAASLHAEFLIKLGFDLAIVGTNMSIMNETLHATKVHIRSSGSGALYSLESCDDTELKNFLSSFNPDFIMVEAWQNALSHRAIELAYLQNIRVGLISHGISVHSFDSSLKSLARAVMWQPYWFIKFKKLLRMCDVVCVLDLESSSKRFADVKRAIKENVPLQLLRNTGYHVNLEYKSIADRSHQITVLGYFSYIKNQNYLVNNLSNILNKWPGTIKFIGKKDGSYYHDLVYKVNSLGLKNRVIFVDDNEVNVDVEIQTSRLVVSTSITEALPILLLEAMHYGTPFVASKVGSQSDLLGGLFFDLEDTKVFCKNVFTFLNNEKLWKKHSDLGRYSYEKYFSKGVVFNQFKEIVGMLEDKS
jgi:glycosyltransferase involved in cell wall biosynthesis